VIRTDTSHAIIVGDKEKTNIEMTELLNEDNKPAVVLRQTWPIYAGILLALATLILLVHFFRNGLSWESAGNRQPVEVQKQQR
jgi:hypothetical protein